jgi:hypothetical protein
MRVADLRAEHDRACERLRHAKRELQLHIEKSDPAHPSTSAIRAVLEAAVTAAERDCSYCEKEMQAAEWGFTFSKA